MTGLSHDFADVFDIRVLKRLIVRQEKAAIVMFVHHRRAKCAEIVKIQCRLKRLPEQLLTLIPGVR